MILSKLYQDIKQEKNRRLVGFCISLHTKAASRGNLFFFVYSIYAKLDADKLIGLLCRFSMGGSPPFVFATVKKNNSTSYIRNFKAQRGSYIRNFKAQRGLCET